MKEIKKYRTTRNILVVSDMNDGVSSTRREEKEGEKKNQEVEGILLVGRIDVDVQATKKEGPKGKEMVEGERVWREGRDINLFFLVQ